MTRGRQGDVAYWLHGAWRQAGDYTAGDGTTVPADFLSREIRGKLGYQIDSRSDLILSAGYQRQDDIDYPGRPLNAEYFDTQNYSARWEMDRSEGLLWSVETLAYLNSVAHGMTNDGKPTAESVYLSGQARRDEPDRRYVRQSPERKESLHRSAAARARAHLVCRSAGAVLLRTNKAYTCSRPAAGSTANISDRDSLFVQVSSFDKTVFTDGPFAFRRLGSYDRYRYGQLNA